MDGKFKEFAVREEQGERWSGLTARKDALYERPDDARSPFGRDYTRILHCRAYRRLKHKTQVFFNTENDHVCTRMEHVAHVESVADSIASRLGLNCELTKAIAFGHDLGHAPFGHQGEKALNSLSVKYLGQTFWHERNGLRMVDEIELLEDDYLIKRNLNLTYAVRDGIICHCGELDENGLTPRAELGKLEDITRAGEVQPATWEGCVVKLADKIAYLGRDVEDAVFVGFIDRKELADLKITAGGVANTTSIMHDLIADVCANSTPERGITMSESAFARLTEIKNFNYERIYRNPRFNTYDNYCALIVNTLFEKLKELYCGADTFERVEQNAAYYPLLSSAFCDWLKKYCPADILPETVAEEVSRGYANRKPYPSPLTERSYFLAVIDFISGMTDQFAVKLFNEQLKF